MENTITTSTTGTKPLYLIGIGLSTILPNDTSAQPDFNELSSGELIAIESQYNAHMQFSTDEYLEMTYKMEFKEKPLYESVDFSFMNLTQKFSEDQVVLEDDFTQVLDELFLSKLNNKPKKRRF